MAISDPVADMLTKVRNASAAKHDHVDVFPSALKRKILEILFQEGFVREIADYTAESGQKMIRVALKYDAKKKPVIHGIKRISKPGRRIYTGSTEIPRILNGHGIVIVSTSQGVLTGRKATDKKVGGELICSIW